ncbi:hypothetical protein DSO57_1015837 [Entomophthora muscae]|uniref:Uncharacterized protein n=1 Tax=Entomophthora muscae TaxID=34485 RepID=A0ACC2TFZ4_9FUNG|nr:hypothetical protein DSO57_1015837 [Entomophthora muscae]
MTLSSMPSNEPAKSPKRDLETMEADLTVLLTSGGSSLKSSTDISSPEVHRSRAKLSKGKPKKTNVIQAVKNLTLNSPIDNSSIQTESSREASPDSNFAYSNSPSTESHRELVDLSNTPSEVGVEKRQRRLQRNRLAAQESRQKKKAYVSDLENQVKLLEEENERLYQQMLQYSDCLRSDAYLESLKAAEDQEASLKKQAFLSHTKSSATSSNFQSPSLSCTEP